MKQNELGRSMIEMLGVLAIIGILSVGGLAGYAKAMAKHRINKSVEQIIMVSTGIKTLFHSQRNYADAGNIDILVKAKIIPSDAVEERVDDSEYTNALEEANNILMNGTGSDQFAYCQRITGDLMGCGQAFSNANGYNLQDFLRNIYKGSVDKVIITPYGGHMTITPHNQIFDLNLLEIPQSYCLELATFEWGVATDGFTTLAINGREFTSPETLSVGTAVGACSEQFNTITLHFK